MKNKKTIRIALSVITTLFWSSCYYDQVLPVSNIITDDVSFSADIIPIFNASCIGCHNTGGQAPDLTPENAYSQLYTHNLIDTNDSPASELYQWMAGNRAVPMPTSGTNPDYNALVLAWIQQGALDN